MEHNTVLEENSLQSYQYETHVPIIILNNTDFDSQAQSEGWDGDGSQEDPYMITGLEIKDPETHLITIRHTNVYFQITNNLIESENGRGIFIYNVTHGIIASNTLPGASIEMIDSANNTISNNEINSQFIIIQRSLNIEISSNTVGVIRLVSSHNNSLMNNEFVAGGKPVFAILLQHSSSNLLSHNIIHDFIFGPGILLLGTSNNNIIVENVLTNNEFGYAQDLGLANVITNNTLTSIVDGIHYRGRDGVISHNLINGNGRAGISLGRLGGLPNLNLIEIGGTFSVYESATNITITENIISNNKRGIFLEDSQEATIMNNTIYSNNLYGLKCNSSSQNNLIKWNDFLDNNQDGTSQAFDAGTDNTFTSNYWFELTTPDSDSDDIVDKPYSIDGDTQNTDPLPRTSPSPDSPDITVPPKSTSSWSLVITMMVFVTIVVFRRRKIN